MSQMNKPVSIWLVCIAEEAVCLLQQSKIYTEIRSFSSTFIRCFVIPFGLKQGNLLSNP